jgi:clan AA aspartic protease (TIGR02281 family)
MQRTIGILAVAVTLVSPWMSVDNASAQTSGPLLVGPSFPCPSPRDPLAQLICSSPSLAEADLRYVQAYQVLRALADDTGQKALRQESVAFTVRVRAQCDIAAPDTGIAASPDAIPCVLAVYVAQRNLLASRLQGPAAEEVARGIQGHVALQFDLKALGFLPPEAAIDGVYGPATRSAISQWQQTQGLPASGLLGNDDAAKLAQQATGKGAVQAFGAGPSPGMSAAYPRADTSAANPTASVPGALSLGRQLDIPLQARNGILTVPVAINGAITLNFVIDSGAADVSVPADVALTLWRAGTIDPTDFIGERTYVLANGTQVPSKVFRIRELKIGSIEIQNVTASITDSDGELLLGQSFLQRFRSWSIDNQRQMLVLNQ